MFKKKGKKRIVVLKKNVTHTDTHRHTQKANNASVLFQKKHNQCNKLVFFFCKKKSHKAHSQNKYKQFVTQKKNQP